jgi:hypothetical protein
VEDNKQRRNLVKEADIVISPFHRPCISWWQGLPHFEKDLLTASYIDDAIRA